MLVCTYLDLAQLLSAWSVAKIILCFHNRAVGQQGISEPWNSEGLCRSKQEATMQTPRYPVAAKEKSDLYALGHLENIGRRKPEYCTKVIPSGAGVTDDELQVWVNARYTGYREAFRRAWIEA